MGSYWACIVVVVGFLTAATVAALPTVAPIESLYGAYEILGKAPGANGETYRGWVRLAVEGETIEVDRCVNRQHTTGLGRVVTLNTDDMEAVEFDFQHRDQHLRATCVYTSDFDNLPRFSCYTYPANSPDIAIPGLESYFAIVWPVAENYFDCY